MEIIKFRDMTLDLEKLSRDEYNHFIDVLNEVRKKLKKNKRENENE